MHGIIIWPERFRKIKQSSHSTDSCRARLIQLVYSDLCPRSVSAMSRNGDDDDDEECILPPPDDDDDDDGRDRFPRKFRRARCTLHRIEASDAIEAVSAEEHVPAAWLGARHHSCESGGSG